MRVVMNGLAALKPKTGVGHHVAQVAAHLSAAYPHDQFALYPGDAVGRLVTRFVHKPVGKPAAGGKPAGSLAAVRRAGFAAAKWAGKRAAAVHFRGFAAAGGFELYHEPNFVPFACTLPTVVTVHDLSVVRYPEWHPADRVRYHSRRFADGLARADHVIVVSEAVRRELLADFALPPDRVSVVYNGVNPGFRPQPAEVVAAVRARLGLPPRYFLCVGTIEPRKNLGTVLRAFADLPAAARGACPLVLAGPWGWKADADREFFDRVAGPAGARHLGYISDADLPALYAGATALLYPSYYEGFGLPPLEMLACGGAVVASTADAVREVVGWAALTIDPKDVAGWRDALRRLADDPDYADELRSGGVAHAAAFTWDRAARDTMAVYRRVLGLPAAQPMPPRSAAA